MNNISSFSSMLSFIANPLAGAKPFNPTNKKMDFAHKAIIDTNRTSSICLCKRIFKCLKNAFSALINKIRTCFCRNKKTHLGDEKVKQIQRRTAQSLPNKEKKLFNLPPSPQIEENNQTEDLISLLPIEIKFHILSSLDPEDLKLTSLLNKEWKDLSDRQRLNALNESLWVCNLDLSFENTLALLKRIGDQLHSLAIPACSDWDETASWDVFDNLDDYKTGNDRTIELIKCCPNIKTLTLECISEDLLKKLAILPLPNLTKPYFIIDHHTSLVPKVFNHFSDGQILGLFPTFQNWQSLTLCLEKFRIKQLITLPNFPYLDELNLHCNYVTYEDIETLVESPKLHNLKKLTLSHVGIDDQAMKLFAKGQFSNLKELNLCNNKIGDTGLSALVTSPYFFNLENINLMFNKIHSADAILALVDNLPKLKKAYLFGNKISDDMKNEIKHLPHFSKLQFEYCDRF